MSALPAQIPNSIAAIDARNARDLEQLNQALNRNRAGESPEGSEVVSDALSRLAEDAGVLYAPHVLGELQRIRAEDPAEYARIRSRVKESKLVAMN